MSANRKRVDSRLNPSGRRSVRARYSQGPSTAIARIGRVARTTGGRRRQNVRSAGFLGIEHKFYDTFHTDTTIVATTAAAGGEIDPTGAGINISAPAQGDKAINRDGKRIMVESVQISGECTVAKQDGESTGKNSPNIFIALVQDTQTNAATLDSEAVFVNPSASSDLGTHPLKNLLSGNRFITHKIWKLDVPAAPMAAATVTDDLSMNGITIPFDCFKKLAMVVDFNGGTTADIANVVNNSLHMIAFVNDASWECVVRYNARIRFVG